MREEPRQLPTSPQLRYTHLLSETVAIQQRYDAVGDQPGTAGVDRKLDADDDEIETLSRRMDQLLCDRVALVREMERPKTIEDAFPAIRQTAVYERRERVARAVAEAFDDAAPPPEGRRPTNHETEAAWKTSDWDAYNGACAVLAREHGYRVDTRRGVWEKDGLRFSAVLYPYPSSQGMGRNSRVGRLYVSSGGASVLEYDRGSWNTVPQDLETLRAIDRFVAVFG